jgi:hypothetical protein
MSMKKLKRVGAPIINAGHTPDTMYLVNPQEVINSLKIETKEPALKGWECPNCHKILSPYKNTCSCKELPEQWDSAYRR